MSSNDGEDTTAKSRISSPWNMPPRNPTGKHFRRAGNVHRYRYERSVGKIILEKKEKRPQVYLDVLNSILHELMKASEEGTTCIISLYVARPVGNTQGEDSPSSHPAASSIHGQIDQRMKDELTKENKPVDVIAGLLEGAGAGSDDPH